jgi:hypothetical protein
MLQSFAALANRCLSRETVLEPPAAWTTYLQKSVLGLANDLMETVPRDLLPPLVGKHDGLARLSGVTQNQALAECICKQEKHLSNL